MIIESQRIEGNRLSWILRCPIEYDAFELSELRIKIDGETENLDRESGEAFLSPKNFEKIIVEDSMAKKTLFFVAEVDGKIVGFARCEGSKLSRFAHKAEFGICISKEYWSCGIGKVLLENILMWADAVGIKKISLNVLQTNTKAIQLYKRYGFTEEGLLLNDRFHKDGNYYNTVVMGRFTVKSYL